MKNGMYQHSAPWERAITAERSGAEPKPKPHLHRYHLRMLTQVDHKGRLVNGHFLQESCKTRPLELFPDLNQIR
jgi:hypothetical protein